MGYVCTKTFGGNVGYVSAVAVTPKSGRVITGCQDGKIRIYHPESVNPSETLSGHTDTGIQSINWQISQINILSSVSSKCAPLQLHKNIFSVAHGIKQQRYGITMDHLC